MELWCLGRKKEFHSCLKVFEELFWEKEIELYSVAKGEHILVAQIDITEMNE